MSSSQDLLKKSQTLKKKKRIGKTIFLVVFLLLLFAGVNYLFFSSKLAINTITVSGNHWVDKEDILASVNKVLAGRYYYLYPKKSILVYPKNEMAKQIQTDWPIISRVTINASGYNSIVIMVKERPDDTVWCQVTGVSKNCFFADPTGYIFAPAPIFSSDVFLELDGLLPALPLGTQPLPEAKYQAITRFMGGLKNVLASTPLSGSIIKWANLENTDQYEVILDKNQAASTTVEWKLILDTDLEPVKQINNLAAILASSQFQKDFNAGFGQLDYLDLRFDQKVFYKFK